MQSSLIFFCYAFIAGLALAKLFPVDARYLFPLGLLTALSLLGVAGAALALARRRMRGEKIAAWLLAWWPLLGGAAVLSGYTRYLAADTVPDQRVGLIEIRSDKAYYISEAELRDASRLRLVPLQRFPGEVRLRLEGRLDARMAIVDEAGRPTLDAQGRWRFRRVRLPQQSEVLTLKGDQSQVFVAQPFTEITNAVAVAATLERGEVVRIAVYRVSNHISTFVRTGARGAPVRILGRIAQDPAVYPFKTVLTIGPQFIQLAEGGPYFRVEGGNVQAVIQPDLPDYAAFARTEAYGYDVMVRGPLNAVRAAANPGGFDPRRFLENHNVYGVVAISVDREATESPLIVVSPAGAKPRRGNLLVEFSLDLRDRLLRVLKMTLPYPHTAFLGGVTLGLRYGLQNTECPFRTLDGHACEKFIAVEFREAGVNHVLAVSGLHVTIITAMFVGLFALLRLPKTVYVPLILVALIVFAIITGARPSVLRAVIMHSLFLLTWAYTPAGIRSSVLLGVPVAAFLILLQNPLVLVDPSFTLSFGAILSLALLTTPVFDLLSRLRGNTLVAVATIAALFTAIGVAHWPLCVNPRFFIPAALLSGAWILWLRRLEERRGIRLIGGLGYSDLPPVVGTFLAAQIGLQVGMMLPLSSYYFCRWPFAGAYANLLAIPLIGIVVQLGAMAGMLGLIPGIGLYLALLLSAANWVFSNAFLWLAHFFGALFPFPFVRRPTPAFLVSYYLWCALWIWHRPLWETLRQRWGRRWRLLPHAVLVALAVLAGIPWWASRIGRGGSQLSVTVLSVGFGSSILIETPGGRRILVDAGRVEHERGRRNEAEQTILPFLAHKGIRRLDALVLTALRPERFAGASYILRHAWVDRVWVPRFLEGLSPEWTAQDLFKRLPPGTADIYSPEFTETLRAELLGSRPVRPSLAETLHARRGTLWNRWAGWVTRTETLRTGCVLVEEQHGDRTLRLEVLYAPEIEFAAYPLENSSVVLKLSYGDFAMLLPSDLHFEGLRALRETVPANRLRANVAIVPHHACAFVYAEPGQIEAVTAAALRGELGPWLDAVRPERVIVEFGNPKPVLGAAARQALRTFEMTWRFLADRFGPERCYSTDRDLAITIESDGRGYVIRTQAEANRISGGEEWEVAENLETAL